MKQLASIVLAIGALAISTPVFACPGMDHDGGGETAAPRTAEKTKEAPKTADQAKQKPQPKQAQDTKTAKPADKAKAPDKAKTTDKVSQR